MRPRPDRVLKVLTTAQGTRKELEVPAAFNPEATITAPLGGTAITFPEQSKTLRLEEDSRRLRAGGKTQAQRQGQHGRGSLAQAGRGTKSIETGLHPRGAPAGTGSS